MRLPRTSIPLCALALLAGCGGSDEEEGRGIPADLASRLETRLNVVEDQFRAGGGACADIQGETFQVIDEDLRAIPADTDPEVRRALEESFARLRDLAASECDEEKGQDTTPTETEETTTLPEVPTETETTPTETDQQEPDDEPGGKKPKKPKDNPGGGQGQGPPGGDDGGAGVPPGQGE